MTPKLTFKSALLAGAAVALFAPAAQAQTAEELAARLATMEAALAEMRAELATVRAQEAARAAMAPERIAPTPAPSPAPTAAPAPVADGFRVGNTTVKLGGFVKAEALYTDFSDGAVAPGNPRDFYVPGATPVGGAGEEAVFDAHAKQTRITLSAERDTGGIPLRGYIEMDFQVAYGASNETFVNGYNPGLRRATLSYGKWLVGQEWTTFQNVSALPETTDFLGVTDGLVMARQALVRFTQPLSPRTHLVLALENPETTAVSAGTAATLAYDEDPLPDAVVRVDHSFKGGNVSVAGLVRVLRVDQQGFSREATGWGVSVSGKVPVGERGDLRFALTGGEGIGRYVGLGFGADAVLTPTDLETNQTVAGFVAYRHAWTKAWRSTVSYSFVEVDYGSALVAQTASKGSQSGTVNLFWGPVPGLDLGVEYRLAERETLNGLTGTMSRLHLIARQSF